MFQSMGNATLLERAAKLYSRGAGMGRWKCEASFASDTEPESAALIQSMEGVGDGGRGPGIPKIASASGDVVERTPPYRTEFHPVDFRRAAIKGGALRATIPPAPWNTPGDYAAN